jgi:hypothetical protein
MTLLPYSGVFLERGRKQAGVLPGKKRGPRVKPNPYRSSRLTRGKGHMGPHAVMILDRWPPLTPHPCTLVEARYYSLWRMEWW